MPSPTDTTQKRKALYTVDPLWPLDDLDPGSALVAPETVSLLVLMVCEIPEESLALFRKHLMEPRQLRRQVAAREVELLDHMLEVTRKLESMGYEVDSRVERGEKTGQVIIDVAEREQVDLVILHRRQQKTWQRVLIGSVVDYVTRHTTRPLLILPD